MRILIALACACGASPPPPEPIPPAVGRPISVEWRAEQADGDLVHVLLVVDGKRVDIGTLDAATETERGSPETCALRAAHPLRTELLCGPGNYYAAELVGEELVITLVDAERKLEVKRVPVYGEGLAVRPYALPTPSDP